MAPACIHGSCERPAKRRGWCGAHYLRQRKGMDMDAPIREVRTRDRTSGPCEHPGCDEKYYGAGLCQRHYHRRYNGMDMDRPRNWNRRVPGVSEMTNKFGYKLTYVPDHPAAFGDGYVFTHRLVMEQVLGRQLRKNENVHHLNGDRADNRPENLELWLVRQPPGQRVSDRVADARRLLALYGNDDEQRRYAAFAEGATCRSTSTPSAPPDGGCSG